LPYTICTFGIEVWGVLKQSHRKALESSSLVITISNFTKTKLIEKGISEFNIFVLAGHIDTNNFNPNVDCQELVKKFSLKDKKVILTVVRISSLERYKGQDVVLNALPKILMKVPNAVYMIIGDGDDKERLRKIAKDLSVEKNTIFTG